MSDCRNGGRLTYLPPEQPTLKRLAELNGEPPWELAVPDYYADTLPEESTELVSVLVWRGARFERARECHAVLGRDGESFTCSECGHEIDYYTTFADDHGAEVLVGFDNRCPGCGAKVVRA